jgi:hemolysin type calcium-binding protein
MKTPLLLVLLMLLVPSVARASTTTYAGGVLAFKAGPHEYNHVRAERATDCETLAAPCLSLGDAGSVVPAPAGCVDTGFTGIRCPLPNLIRVDLGDRTDFYNDWDGPSVVHGGPDGDSIYGAAGDDVLFGDEADDAVVGGPGDDQLDGGLGNDWLDSYIDGYGFDRAAEAEDSAGTDTLRGGEGVDWVDYEHRTDPLTITLDGRANDGAAGENDLIGPDVEAVKSGWGADTLTGGPRPDRLYGMAGDDMLRGGPGEDILVGGEGDDGVFGDAGGDSVEGGDDNDLVDGGAGKDELFGEYHDGCTILGCVGGNDEIRARDGEADYVDCNNGDDHAIVDVALEVDLLGSCERIDVAGGGANASVCDILPRADRPVCRIKVRALASCQHAKGARHKRCLKRAVRRATRTCRKRFRGRKRTACVRSVRRLL